MLTKQGRLNTKSGIKWFICWLFIVQISYWLQLCQIFSTFSNIETVIMIRKIQDVAFAAYDSY